MLVQWDGEKAIIPLAVIINTNDYVYKGSSFPMKDVLCRLGAKIHIADHLKDSSDLWLSDLTPRYPANSLITCRSDTQKIWIWYSLFVWSTSLMYNSHCCTTLLPLTLCPWQLIWDPFQLPSHWNHYGQPTRCRMYWKRTETIMDSKLNAAYTGTELKPLWTDNKMQNVLEKNWNHYGQQTTCSIYWNRTDASGGKGP